VAIKSDNGGTKIWLSPQHRIYERAESALIRLSIHFREREFDKMLV